MPGSLFREHAAARGPYTYEDYALLPDDGRRYELLEGEILVSPAPKTRHQMVLQKLFKMVDAWAEKGRAGTVLLAPCDMVLSPQTVLQPDLVFIARKHSGIITEDNVQGVPDLVVEVISPWSAERDRDWKRRVYERHGVPCYWIVDPEERRLTAYRRGADDFVLEAALGAGGVFRPADLPELEIDLADLWPAGR
ncbi:MAG: Uma2 family endonuclease [Thermaerobacter sp.]|nr:Uma2 family endonuclease [Thermaerobacter sp.]